MDPVKQTRERVKRYHRLRIILFFVTFFMEGVFLFLFVQLKGAHALRNFLVREVSLPWAQVFVYAVCLSVSLYFLELPVHFFKEYLLEKRHGLSTFRPRDWWWRDLKRAVLSLLFFVLLVETGYFFVWTAGESWWVGLASCWFIYSWILAQLFPVWIVPLFYRATPLQDEALLKMLKTFAMSQGRSIDSVRVLNFSKETKKANAAVLGIGRRKRIVLGDTLLNRLNHEEIKVIFAHELGHDKELHLWLSLFFNALVILGGIYGVQRILTSLLPSFQITHLSDLAALPLFLILFSLFGFFLMPIQNGFSRLLEQRADAFALRTTGLKGVFISAMKKLAEQNFSDASPNRFVEIFFHSHPSISRRIEFAEKF